MEWYQYLALFFSGAFLANAVPHFVNGVSGDKFPTPFAKPPGKGLSPPYINVLWAAFNAVVGYLLLHVGGLKIGEHLPMAIFFAGALVMSLISSKGFTQKQQE